jgi:hypothetical protein
MIAARRVAWSVAFMLVALAAAALAQVPTDESLAAARIIVKPLAAVANGDDLMRTIAAKLPDERRLQYFREMSGGAHVISVVQPASAADVASILRQLANTGLFEYVELDRMLKARDPNVPN